MRALFIAAAAIIGAGAGLFGPRPCYEWLEGVWPHQHIGRCLVCQPPPDLSLLVAFALGAAAWRFLVPGRGVRRTCLWTGGGLLTLLWLAPMATRGEIAWWRTEPWDALAVEWTIPTVAGLILLLSGLAPDIRRNAA